MSRTATPAWTLVESSAIRALAYDEAAEVLFLEYAHGGRYAYEHVTASEYAGLKSAGSIGQYVNAVIKPQHPVARLEQQEDPV